MAKEETEEVGNCELPKSIWKNPAPMKVQIVCWLAILEKINTMDRLQKSMPHICWRPQQCIMCRENGENVNHIFMHCSVAKFLGSKLLSKAAIIGPLPFSRRSSFRQDWYGFGKNKKGKIIWNAAMVAIVWVIWKERNRRIFMGKDRCREEFWDRVVYLGSLRTSIKKKFEGISYFFIRNNWEPVISYQAG